MSTDMDLRSHCSAVAASRPRRWAAQSLTPRNRQDAGQNAVEGRDRLVGLALYERDIRMCAAVARASACEYVSSSDILALACQDLSLDFHPQTEEAVLALHSL